jgi:hypothetical protein
MPRYWVRPLILIVALAVIAVVALVQHERYDGTVYSVRQVVTSAQSSPVAWIGRVVLVKGRVIETDVAGVAGHGLIDTNSSNASTGPYLPVVNGSPDLLNGLLRRIPLLQSLAPPMQVLAGAEVYRLRLDPRTCQPGERSSCYQAVLLDAKSGGP